VADIYATNAGPFKIMMFSDENVQFVDHLKFTAFPDFKSYIVYMWVGNDMFSIDIDDFIKISDVSKNALLNTAYRTHPELLGKGERINWLNMNIRDKLGIIGEADVPGSYPRYVAIYSPDGIDNQGRIILVTSAFTENRKKVERVMNALKIGRNS
jgi:hypothetical protein